MLVVDFRTSQYTPVTVPDLAWVPLADAHLIVETGKATVYRWYAQNRIQGREIAKGRGAAKLYVNAGEVRELYRHMRTRRHAGRRARNGETVR